MLVIRIWNYFRGYVIIKIEGLTLEKFINLAISKNIILWDIIRIDYTTLKAKVSVAGFKELRDVVQKVGCRVSVVEKKGYPFFINKFKYRKMLALGSVISISLVIFFTSFIWRIDIVGNERIKDEEITNVLLSMNVKEGIRKSAAKKLDISNGLLLNIQDLSFANVEIRGTKMIIEVKERALSQVDIKEDTPCNIVASKKAVIEKIVVKNGKALVEKGDVVKEGQVLITGIVKDENLASPLFVHSEGIVFARTKYTEIIEEPIIKFIDEETGKTFTTREIVIGSKRIQLMNGEIPFENYVEEKKVKEIGDLGIIKLPIITIQHIYKEVERTKIKQDVDALKQITAVQGTQQLMEKIPKESNVISKDVRYSIEDNLLITEIIVEVSEDIGVKEKIN
ncbi:sporulation protein YqfD [Proteiniborus sp. MB09-C3]|uniref:sporulation protein YqfD n=1 Tax=Proteiniborus sp. MB09-C3 TaxID=3050072 RepID=UPI002555AA8D|nr:sporulation protein YqfD [Proteiniborus sp. MB09-C3]WIV10692.1 sporulation protein YqfD [Proteiniborus sp. MB09-C3]